MKACGEWRYSSTHFTRPLFPIRISDLSYHRKLPTQLMNFFPHITETSIWSTITLKPVAACSSETSGKRTYHPTLYKNPEDQHLRSTGLKQHDIIFLTHHCLSSTNTAISLLNCCYFSIFYIYLHVLHSSSTLFSNLNATFSSLFSFTFPPLSLILSLTFTS